MSMFGRGRQIASLVRQQASYFRPSHLTKSQPFVTTAARATRNRCVSTALLRRVVSPRAGIHTRTPRSGRRQQQGQGQAHKGWAGGWVLATSVASAGIVCNMVLSDEDQTFPSDHQSVAGPHQLTQQSSLFDPSSWVRMVQSMDKSTMLIVTLNCAVFGLWTLSKQGPQFKSLSMFMQRHFLGSWIALRQGRLWTSATTMFSHQGGFHFFFNTFAFMSIAPTLVKVMGEEQFLSFYLAAGVSSDLAASAFAFTMFKIFKNTKFMIPHLGASGAVYGCIAVLCMLVPETRFQLIFLPFFSFEAEDLLLALVAFDGCGLAYSVVRSSPLGHSAHLTGLLAGYLFLKYKLMKDNVISQRLVERNHRNGRRTYGLLPNKN